ncbi:MAG TPA: hypothetical protein VFT69_09240 [Pseudolabrys sp.]|nr:hypothetical protein [Pseudolabrys sp.]
MAKPRKSDAPDTEAVLSQARAHVADLKAKQVAHDLARDAALLADDKAGVERAEANAATTVKEIERAERRMALLEEKAQAELRQRQERAWEEAVEHAAALFRERDAHGEELARHLAAAVLAFQKMTAANAAAQAGWQFDFADNGACLFGRLMTTAVQNEMYRLSGVEVEQFDGLQFPGAQCPTPFTDKRASSVRPLVDRLHEATAWAVAKMRATPMRVLPIAAPVPEQPPEPAASVGPIAAEQPLPPSEPAAAEAEAAPKADARKLEFAFFVRMANTRTAEEKTFEVLLTPEDVEEASLDGLGPFGPRGRQIALRRACDIAGADFVFRPGQIFANLARLDKSLNAA